MERVSLRNVDLETLFLIGAIVFAGWIFLGSLAFPETARLYPFYTSLAVIVLGGLLLFQKHPPSVIRQRLDRSEGGESSFFATESGDEFDEDEEVNERSVVIMALIYGGYIVFVNLVGFLLSSMALMYVVQRYYDYGSRLSRLLSVVLVGGFVYAGYIILDVDLDQGMLWNTLL